MGQVCFTAISSNRACPTVFMALSSVFQIIVSRKGRAMNRKRSVCARRPSVKSCDNAVRVSFGSSGTQRG